ncbi:uncharacterized protein B4U79_04172 [Dinothrombium tinctorium]|uniref:Sorbin and SH3 domain-containing protein 1-like protein n=1 Tax=Dinothrombium tinctorium TaxID=1965070 RepID=A0A443R276_9ACAR|nr:uncharacterized protein B4U79_04172 [Dinothrombium tinctorium]
MNRTEFYSEERKLVKSQSEEEILSPSEDQEYGESVAQTLVKPLAESRLPQAGPSTRPLDQQSDLTPSDIPLALSPQSEESDMSSVTQPSFKARAPKNIWSPGSTTTSSSSDSTSTTIPATTASATQTTPTKTDAKASTLPHGFRTVDFPHLDRDTSMLNINTSLPGSSIENNLVSPSSASETSVETGKQLGHISPPPSPLQRYWTLPRQVASTSKDDYVKQVVTDKAPPPEAKFLYETPSTKYYTLPTSVTERSATTIPAPPKFDGIGPVDGSGIPLTLRTGVKEEFREDWYKTMFKRLHKVDEPKTERDEPLRIKYKPHKPGAIVYSCRSLFKCFYILRSLSDYRFNAKYFEEDDRNRVTPRNIADYEPGHSSISLREKQMAEDSEKEAQDSHEKHKRSSGGVPYHPNCVFNALTSTNGYESDSSYIIKKKEPKSAPTPASRSTYCAVQRGDIDIPISGLQKPAPQPRSHKGTHVNNICLCLHKNAHLILVGPSPPLRAFDQLSTHYSQVPPPQRPPSPQILSDKAIDDWQRKMNADFNDIYQALQKKQTIAETNLETLPRKNNAVNDAAVNKETVTKSKHKFEEDQVNIHYKSPIQQLVKDSILNDEDLVKRQREQMRRFYESELERRHLKESQNNAQRRHHFTPKQDHIVHLDRYQRAYIEKDSSQLQQNLLARVIFDFHALSPRELSIKKGDIVIVHRPVNHNWVEVEDSQSGLKGLVPKNYLDFDREGSAKAKYDFDAKTPVEISLKKSEMVKLLRKVDDNWYEGINSKGEIGIFPCSYVETLKPPLYLQLNNNYSYRPTSPPLQQYSRSLSPPVCPPSPSRPMNGTTVYKEQLPASSSSSSGKQQKLYRVLYPYKPQQADELELLAGDILTVTMQCDDGWYLGHSTLTGQYGTFPGNYVELLM